MERVDKPSAGEEARSAGAGRTRFRDPFWRAFDTPTAGYRDSTGFVNRLPLRLESTELIVYGTVDADRMWSEYADEPYEPVRVGGRGVVTVWFNNFTDTDCGGAYLETWYNTFVTKRGARVDLPAETPFSVLEAAAVPGVQSFLIRVLCGDVDDNPGAARKAIAGGREIFGFPKHPDTATIRHHYRMTDGRRAGLEFDCHHHDAMAVTLRCALPETDPDALTVPVEVARTPDDASISGPRLGGTHRGHNGANQTLYATSLKCTQVVAAWNAETDSLTLGDNEHYRPLARWGYEPAVKVHAPDFKICAHRPSGWLSGPETVAALEAGDADRPAGTDARP